MSTRVPGLCLLLAAALSSAHARDLEIYWIDVEGGASTLIITPSGQSMLVDAGNPGPNDRDPKRVFEAAKAAGLKRIDILLTTHYLM
ncbi:MAG TPA: MBL fold metallo-hydrolase [Bryobacteraceae bacterium]|nr:MBL fold metallo-hydrolase [Bryobacteraceae bacterium]